MTTRDRTLRPAAAALTLLLGLATAPAFAQNLPRALIDQPNHPCGSLLKQEGGYGPFDYRTQRDKLSIVESFHFTAKVESLSAGQSGTIGGDLDYTLRAFPNHHRALVALTRWTERNRTDRTDGMNYPVYCYYDRALRFAPNDTIVRALYAQFLHKAKRTDDALAQLDRAVVDAGDNPLSLHNLGLVYAEMGAFDRALKMAHRAAELGMPDERSTLRDQLVKAGRWRAPEPAPAGAAGASAPAAAASGAQRP